MKAVIRLPVALLAVLMFTTAAVAQESATIVGVVTDASGQALSGANVQVVGTALGTITNADGRYVLRLPASRVGDEITLRASLIGRMSVSQEVTVTAGSSTVNFELGEDPLRLDEIVVTGQGTERQREKVAVTVSSVDAEEVVNSQESNVISALAGKAPNVQVTTSTGEPGGGAYIQIRGANTIYGDTQPLIVVDGTPIDNDSYTIETTTAGTAYANRAIDLNPDDIESVEVLRGPAAGAIYGSRAASGVVIITTKKGQPGQNRWTYKQVVSVDEVNQNVPLQTSYGQGWGGTAMSAFPADEQAFWWCAFFGVCGPDGDPLPPEEAQDLTDAYVGQNIGVGTTSWGEELDPETDTFNHANEIFRTGLKIEEDLSVSGGSERTTYYFSVGRTDHTGVIDGESEYRQTQARLRGSHALADNLTLSGNVAYTDAGGDLIQTGSNISGIMLAALRTPPEFNNRPYLDPETGFHRSYRLPNPTSLTESRGYDNPFWVANELLNTTDVSRTIGQAEISYDPVPWLNVNYLFGVDYSNDDRYTEFPKSTSTYPEGALIRANLANTIFDSNLVLTANRTFSEDFAATLTAGQNINIERFKQYQTNAFTLIAGANQLDYTVAQTPNEFESEVTTIGYFGQANLDLYDQLFLTGTMRLDAASTFGSAADDWFVYPQATAAWDFTTLPMLQEQDWLSFGKVRVAYGRTGRQPPAYSNITDFVTSTLSDGWLLPNGLRTIYGGQEGVHSTAVLGNQSIQPETTTGLDVGLDLAFLNNRVNFSATYYQENTEDIILNVPLGPSTGFLSRWANAAAIDNEGWELTLGVTPVQTDDFRWSMDAQWATNESCVTDLAGAEFIGLGGFTGSQVGLYRPDEDGTCYEYNTFYGGDWVRFGRGTVVGGVDIDDTYSGWEEGDVYIGEDGLPIQDSRQRAFGNANPDWTGSLRTTFTFMNNLQVSALFDANIGSRMWNGTKGALYFFGTHEETERFHGLGADTVFAGVGPGAGEEVNVNYINWFVGSYGSGFTGPFTQFIEDASFVKLRDISVSYAFDTDLLSRFGVDGMRLQVSGRNLYTWTDYTGIDPESNLTGQTAARGLDYFNIPRTRSFVFTLSLNQ